MLVQFDMWKSAQLLLKLSALVARGFAAVVRSERGKGLSIGDCDSRENADKNLGSFFGSGQWAVFR
jgi:hypothetical protein